MKTSNCIFPKEIDNSLNKIQVAYNSKTLCNMENIIVAIINTVKTIGLVYSQPKIGMMRIVLV